MEIRVHREVKVQLERLGLQELKEQLAILDLKDQMEYKVQQGQEAHRVT